MKFTTKNDEHLSEESCRQVSQMAGEIIGLLSENEIETEEALFALAGSIAFILCTFNKLLCFKLSIIRKIFKGLLVKDFAKRIPVTLL